MNELWVIKLIHIKYIIAVSVGVWYGMVLNWYAHVHSSAI